MKKKLNSKLLYDNPVVFLLNARGDYILNLPTIRALSYVFDSQFTLVAKKGARNIFFR